MQQTVSNTADAIEMELTMNRQSAWWNDSEGDRTLAPRYEDSITAIRSFVRVMRESALSGTYTSLGLLERARTLAAPLHQLAEGFDREAASIDDRISAGTSAAWAALNQGAQNDRERWLFTHLWQKFESEERHQDGKGIVLAQQLLHAARTGEHDDMLRAALTYPAPPIDIEGAVWCPLLRPALVEEIRRAVAERVSPFGDAAWRVTILRGLASHLRNAVSNYE